MVELATTVSKNKSLETPPTDPKLAVSQGGQSVNTASKAAKARGGNENRIHPISESYLRSRRGTLQDKKWEDVETDEISEQVTKQPLFFRDFLPRGMTTKKDAMKTYSPKSPVQTPSASSSKKSSTGQSSAQGAKPPPPPPEKEVESKPEVPAFDASRKTWSAKVVELRGVAEDTTEAYLQWLLVQNFQLVSTRFAAASREE